MRAQACCTVRSLKTPLNNSSVVINSSPLKIYQKHVTVKDIINGYFWTRSRVEHFRQVLKISGLWFWNRFTGKWVTCLQTQKVLYCEVTTRSNRWFFATILLKITKAICPRTIFLCLSNSFWNLLLYSNRTYIIHMSHNMTKPTKWVCAQRRLRSAWASAQSDQSPPSLIRVFAVCSMGS